MRTDTLIERLDAEIAAAKSQQRINPDTMFLVEARDEIIRLEAALQRASDEIEQLFKYVNETRGHRVNIVREVRVP